MLEVVSEIAKVHPVSQGVKTQVNMRATEHCTETAFCKITLVKLAMTRNLQSKVCMSDQYQRVC